MIAITGAEGFIGRKLCESFKEKNIPFIPFKGNLLSEKDVKDFFSSNSFETIIHLVGSFDLPFTNLMQKNVMTTGTLLEIGRKYNLKKIVYTSSGAVYGEPSKKKSKETDSVSVNTLYGLSKIFAENIIQYYEKNHGISYLILRLPNVYGPGSKRGVIFEFMQSFLNNKSIRIYGNGLQKRDFLFIDDAIEAIQKATLMRIKNKIINIASGKTMSLIHLISLMEEIFSKKVSIHFEDPKEGVVRELSEDIQKAKKILRWKPRTHLKTGLVKTQESIDKR